jgi:uncharacterized protein YsxB (DUF464 family)
MIHVWVQRNQDDEILEITVDGHADFADRGFDIVCAAVSALSIGITNSIEKFLDIKLNPTDEGEEGFMWIQVPKGLSPEQMDQLQLLLKTLSFSLKGIADQYSEFVRYLEDIIEEDISLS